MKFVTEIFETISQERIKLKRTSVNEIRDETKIEGKKKTKMKVNVKSKGKKITL